MRASLLAGWSLLSREALTLETTCWGTTASARPPARVPRWRQPTAGFARRPFQHPRRHGGGRPMRSLKFLVIALFLAALTASGPALGAGRWSVVPSQSPSSQANYLSAV